MFYHKLPWLVAQLDGLLRTESVAALEEFLVKTKYAEHKAPQQCDYDDNVLGLSPMPLGKIFSTMLTILIPGIGAAAIANLVEFVWFRLNVGQQIESTKETAEDEIIRLVFELKFEKEIGRRKQIIDQIKHICAVTVAILPPLHI